MSRVAETLCQTVQTEMIERGFGDPAEWQRIREDLLALDDDNAENWGIAAQGLLEQLSVSHVMLLSPDRVAAIKAANADGIPEVLCMSSQRGNGWLYIKLPSFTIPAFTVATFMSHLDQLRPDDALVLDLRLNGGGSLSAAGEALGPLLGSDVPYARTRLDDDNHPLVVTPFAESENVDHAADVAVIEAGPTVWLTSPQAAPAIGNPVIVLTGRRCYSAGEIFCRAVKESGRGTLVGETTGGAVVAGREHALPGGWEITLPFATMTSGENTVIEGTGVAPDTSCAFRVPDTQPMPPEEIESIVTAA